MMRSFAIALLAVVAVAISTANAATQPSTARYTQREISKLHHHACAEDEYMFVPARWVNPAVAYATPDRALCVSIDNTRPARRIG